MEGMLGVTYKLEASLSEASEVIVDTQRVLNMGRKQSDEVYHHQRHTFGLHSRPNRATQAMEVITDVISKVFRYI